MHIEIQLCTYYYLNFVFTQNKLADIPLSENPMEVVGIYLDKIVNPEILKQFYLPKRFKQPVVPGLILHVTQEYSQLELIKLIISECKGIPESYDILFCMPMSTKEEIQSFMKRVKMASQRHMFILEVNNLPYSLQEVPAILFRNWICFSYSNI